MANGSHIIPWRTGIASFMALLACAATLSAAGPNSQGKILAGFFEEWSIYYAKHNIADLQNNGVAGRLSHFIYAFANVSATVSSPSSDACTIADSYADYETPYLPPVDNIPDTGPLYGNFAEILKLKALHPHLRTLISIGGASATNMAAFSLAAGTAAGRQALATSCINMFITGNVASGISAPGLFDGIHIDWEFPTAADTQNFTLLLQEFRKQLNALGRANGKYYELSFDGPAGEQNYSNIELAKTARLVDFITIDGYNHNGAWEGVANHASPLFDSRKDPEFGEGLCIACTVNAYLNAGVPPSKYVMGVPLYGAGWTGIPNVNHGLYQTSTDTTEATWSAPVLVANGSGLCTDLSGNTPGCDPLLNPGQATYSTLATLTANGYRQYFDPVSVAAWLYDPATETFWSFDDPFTASLKTVYVQTRVPGGLGGNFVWALKDDDANGTMVKTLATGLGR
ncbi:MAG: glycosyl hydrolase family 18 protein [Terriglobia bacterium]|jgi:chitinase